jgi:hypothetical protein
VFDELLFTVDEATANLVATSLMADLNLHERQHLQEWILAHPQILGVGVEVIASEYADWQDAKGEKVADRLDILGVDGDGRLVVAELKRDAAPHTIHMQAINYAAMVSRLSLNDLAEMYAARRRRLKSPVELDAALVWLQTEKLVTTETLKNPRIVLVATHFPVAVTASVVWLNEQGVDISLVRFRPYRLPSQQVVVAFSQLFPVPDVEEFTIGRRTGASAPLGDDEPGPDWDEDALRRLAGVANAATLTAMDLCAQLDASGVSVIDIMAQAGLSNGQVKGHLAGLTMLLKNKKNGFAQSVWPFSVTWLPTGTAAYHMDNAIAEIWRAIRGQEGPAGSDDQAGMDSTNSAEPAESLLGSAVDGLAPTSTGPSLEQTDHGTMPPS